MKKELLDFKEQIEECSYELWKGNGTDVKRLNGVLYDASQIILSVAEELNEEDKTTTINYIKNGLADFEKACNNRDDFMLADCLFFEWREIVSIYADVWED